MSKELKDLFEETAEAIREKLGSTKNIKAENFPEEIRKIVTTPSSSGTSDADIQLTLKNLIDSAY